MKPFDLEAAKRGEKLVTRDGREVTEFHHFGTVRNTAYSCCAVIDGKREIFAVDGMNFVDRLNDNDLFMAPKTRTVFVNVYNHPGMTDDPTKGHKAYAFNSEQDARDNVNGNAWGLLAVAQPVEIEE
jgi:hypothetical protein